MRIRELSEKLWTGEVRPEDAHPFTPLLALEELGPGAAFVSSFANSTALVTDAGLVLFDTGAAQFVPRAHQLVRGWSKAPLHTAVFTHGHIDHVAGVELYEESGPARVVAHAAVPARFARYGLTAGYNACINTRQFGTPVAWPQRFRAPDLLYTDALALDVGGVAIELHHARGETDDHTWAFVPSHRLLVTGDLFIWATPNAGNPQKVQRYPREWAAALRQMSALGAETLCPGHGVPIFGADRVRRALDETAELLESLVDQTLALMNAGARLDEVLATVTAPAHLLARPYLRPIYDEPEFIVRNTWRLYGGWYDGDPAHLKPARAAALAHELARLAGGAHVLAARATELAAAGDLALAAHLAETAALAAPGDAAIKRARAAIYAQRAKTETSLMARGIFAAAARD